MRDPRERLLADIAEELRIAEATFRQRQDSVDSNKNPDLVAAYHDSMSYWKGRAEGLRVIARAAGLR